MFVFLIHELWHKEIMLTTDGELMTATHLLFLVCGLLVSDLHCKFTKYQSNSYQNVLHKNNGTYTALFSRSWPTSTYTEHRQLVLSHFHKFKCKMLITNRLAKATSIGQANKKVFENCNLHYFICHGFDFSNGTRTW